MEIRERLLSRDDAHAHASPTRWSTGCRIDSHTATITVEEEGGGSKVTWAYDVTPDEMAPIFGDTYKAALAAAGERVRLSRRARPGVTSQVAGAAGSPTLTPVTRWRARARTRRRRRSPCAAAADRGRAADLPAPAARADPARAAAPRPHHRQGGRLPLRPDRGAPARAHPPGRAAGGPAGPPAAQELPGPGRHLHEVRPDHRLVAGHVRRRRGRRVPGLPRHGPGRAVPRRAPAGGGGPRAVAARRLRRIRPAADRDGVHRRGAQGPAARRPHGGGQGAASRDRARGGHRPRPDAAVARDPGAPDGRPDGRLHPAAARRLPGADRRGDGPAQRGALAGALPPPAERVRPEADGGARAAPRPVGAQRAHHGVLRRRAHRRPGPGGRARVSTRRRWSRR